MAFVYLLRFKLINDFKFDFSKRQLETPKTPSSNGENLTSAPREATLMNES